MESFNDNENKKNNYMTIVIYIILFISAIIIASDYYKDIPGHIKYLIIILAGLLNVPFIFYYSIWNILLKKQYDI